jgi:hypothetical protein
MIITITINDTMRKHISARKPKHVALPVFDFVFIEIIVKNMVARSLI